MGAPPFRSDLCACGVREGHSYYFVPGTYLFRVTAPAAFSTAGRKPRTSQPITRGRQEVRERSLCNRYRLEA
jgi:hypothetical protein